MAWQSIMFYEMSNIHCNAHKGIKSKIISRSQTARQLEDLENCKAMEELSVLKE